MPDGSHPGYSGYNEKKGYGIHTEKPKPVENIRPPEKDPKNFFDRKRDEWMNAMNDRNLASDIAQSIRSVLFAIPEGKTPRTQEETHTLYEGIETLVRNKMISMRLSGLYGDDLRFVTLPPWYRKDFFEFIDHKIPSLLLDNPKQDLDSFAILESVDYVNDKTRWQQEHRDVIHSSERLAKFADAVSQIFIKGDYTLRYFVNAFETSYAAPRRAYGFHRDWGWRDGAQQEREDAYEKEMVQFNEQVKDDALFDATIETLKQITLQNDSYQSEMDYEGFIRLTPEDRVEFLSKVPQFSAKGIGASFLLNHRAYFKNADPSKEGFAMFQTPKEKYEWLDRCLNAMFNGYSQKNNELVGMFVKEALANPVRDKKKQSGIGSAQLKGIDPRMASEIDEDLDEDQDDSSREAREANNLQRRAKEFVQKAMVSAIDNGYMSFDTFSKMEKLLGETGLKMAREFDRTAIQVIKDEDLGSAVGYVNDKKFGRYLPNTHKQFVARIIEKVGVDAWISESVAASFSSFINRPDAEELARKLSGKLSNAQALYKYFLDSSESKPWQKNLMSEMEAMYTSAVLNPPPPKSRDFGTKETFLDADPYEKHPHKYGGSSMRLGDVMSGKKTPEEIGLDLNPENVEFLREANRILDEEHQAFLGAVDKSALIPPEDKIAYMNPKESLVKMNDVKETVRAFLARYLAQSVVKRTDQLTSKTFSSEALRVLIHDGYANFLDVYATDIPLYDKLYEEFDALREAGRSPLEVYLGRDGIYAYIGRKAQDAMRKAVLGKEKVEGLRAEGEVVTIEPKYLVYPSYVRDEVATDTKIEYLNYSGVTKESDPLFYDTGFSGSIPQQIMQIMGFDKAQIEERIRLLSAPTNARRMRGIPANATSDVVGKIEGNAKSEDTASGLVKNKETGRITHSARPARPEDQFKFSLIRQAIARHYLIQEKLHYKVPENTILDSEKFTLRIRSEYAEQLPDAFKNNPIQFLETQGTPEDGAVLMKLKDGTEVMARRVAWTKTEQAQTEYAILISAKKAGVPAAEPVGFVTGKSKEDESVILSKKIEGVPGKRFEKTLRESGYTEEKIAELMRELQGQIEAVTSLLKQTLNITGNWKVNDVAVQFNEETGVIERVIPLKWEQVKRRDEEKEKRVRELIKKPERADYYDR
ncbi:hypothetical protein A3C09_04385 [Candidatus Uhrbacteria bacterium RIFCSPHIGHO2_02_FULL_47_44]|uniref:Uncharacterized protein n=1 Tax=Candidatus Uhrbacteria bacterium RIFCSPLOWO2_02_FULL_48_18 TaxID=1802408 RepID=A0A1F7V8C6_9BACT|nr:MAG: hypothetical protein A2839_02730 [Candidatus Uhrbacteria bacterium RIFCSPHIGHO2_01_FULL_47_10]OGL70776.1 MAG: hypothetical protein A3C09_04385 [Candidatus Uhrbacteria bacterium RIFCSPHIGHO2_02_FULL_47_44]OGL75949.1 MAG: hypothetical protein A3E97_04745 [Candidatus Uhrbacteria bacterium RIFCSPHIGHO2_12_FULL_47_12]OGL82240.1 MAG: hypothetical protein A3B20_00610 [Candidatus Uhrbacteria bacterium RIFCSPLOWO2_01_FULL_47_17]OGL86730.1 MAG: hypothetical protein A3I41_05375 [Candidatus Uhrbact